MTSWPLDQLLSKPSELKLSTEEATLLNTLNEFRRPLLATEITHAILWPEWQACRRSMFASSTYFKLRTCANFADTFPEDERTVIVITNYLNALRRAGLIPAGA